MEVKIVELRVDVETWQWRVVIAEMAFKNFASKKKKKVDMRKKTHTRRQETSDVTYLGPFGLQLD